VRKMIYTYMLILFILISSIQLTVSQQSQQPRTKTLLLIIPGIEVSKLKYGVPLEEYINRSSITIVKPIPIYNDLYYELLILNTSLDPKKVIVHNDTVEFMNGSIVKPWEALNYTQIENIWSNTTVFINIRSLNPLKNNRTLNPYFNLTKQIPPQILVVPINGSIKWNLLNTTVNITLSDNTFRITLEEYNIRGVVFHNETNATDHIFINVSKPGLGVPMGKYHIKFRIIDYNETHVIIFTLGSREVSDWLSSSFGIFVKPVTPYIPFEYFKYMGKDDIKWVIEEVMSFYQEMISVAYRYKNAILEVFEIPLFVELHEAYLQNYIDEELMIDLEKLVVDGINKVLNITKLRLGETNIIIYIPFTYRENSTRLFIEGLYPIEPGLYRVENESMIQNITTTLLKNDIEFKILNIRDKYYVFIYSYEHIINGLGGIDNGYLIVYPSSTPGHTNVVIDTENVIGYISSLAKGYGIGMSSAGEIIEDLRSEIKDLNDKIRDLNGTVRALNDRIARLNISLGQCRAKYLNLSNNISNIINEWREAKEREKQLMIYSITGTISILVIVLTLYYIGRRGLSKQR